jgi:hypothetical protein
MKRSLMLAALAGLFAWTTPARALVLYDGTTDANPAANGNLGYFGANGLTPGTYYAGGPPSTTLDTTADGSIRAGWSPYKIGGGLVNSGWSPLNRTTGFVIDFTARVNSETATSEDRGGFSVIALGSDQKGIELAFSAKVGGGYEVFAQRDDAGGTLPAQLFTKGEAADLPAATSLTAYSLKITTRIRWHRDRPRCSRVPYATIRTG